MISAASFNKRELILSNPTALLVLTCFNLSSTDCTFIGSGIDVVETRVSLGGDQRQGNMRPIAEAQLSHCLS